MVHHQVSVVLLSAADDDNRPSLKETGAEAACEFWGKLREVLAEANIVRSPS